MKRVLILSEGPVPVPEHTQVEGGGLRCWGLAKGLESNSEGELEITVAYNEHFKKPDQFSESFENIRLATWTLETLPQLLSDFESVVVSYCMGTLSLKTAELLRPNQQLVLDCYVPIYVEVSARQSANIAEEYGAFHGDAGNWGKVLQRGDLFLCASAAQKSYYRGVLSAVGRINPITYGHDLIMIVPYGIYPEAAKAASHPIQDLVGPGHEKYKKILWFGGIYPWFDLRQLVQAVAALNRDVPARLIIVGAKNPFNTHPDFVRRYDELIEFIHAEQHDDLVKVQDWVDFNDRANWYLDADAVVVVNKLGEENSLAWRTRLVDFMWADLPIITNGGDPLSEILIASDAAVRFTDDAPSAMAKSLHGLLAEEGRLKSLKANLAVLRPNYLWGTVTKDLSAAIRSGLKAPDLEQMGVYSLAAGQPGFGASRISRIMRRASKIPAYARKHGTKNTINTINSVVQRKLASFTPSSGGPGRMVFISHQLDMSGAPFVIMDMAKEVRQSHPKLPVAFFTYTPTHHLNVTELNRIGIKPGILIDKNMIPQLRNQDIVVLNTSAHSEALKDDLFGRLESGRLAKLVWYIHEDEPELIFRPDEHRRLSKLLASGKLKILIAGEKMRHNYIEYFGHPDALVYQTYKMVTEKKFHAVRPASDFESRLSFVLPGTVGDGRKGQLPLFYAFAAFDRLYFQKNPTHYRDFELVYVGVINDFLSRQLLKHKDTFGPGRFKAHGKVTKQENLEIVARSNMTICYSMRECLPLFVFEGMINGHPLLRNDSSGVDEQLEDGGNGHLLKSDDFWQVVATIERVLNKTTTTNEQLAAMSQRSYDMAKAFETKSYLPGVAHEIDALTRVAHGE